MLNLVSAELYKFKKSKGVLFSLVFSFIIPLIVSIYINLCTIINPNGMKPISGEGALYNSMSMVLWSNFLFSIFAAIFVASEFQNKNIINAFTYNYSRFKIIISKFIIFALGVIIIHTIIIVTTTSIFTIINGFGENINLFFIFSYLRMYFLSTLCSIAVSSISFFIAVVSKNSICTVLSSILVLGLFIISNTLLVDAFSKFLPIHALLNSIGINSLIGKIILSFFSSIITLFILTSLSYFHIKNLDF